MTVFSNRGSPMAGDAIKSLPWRLMSLVSDMR
jgi:hypothetical protein